MPAETKHWLWPPCVADADIIFLPCGFFYLFSLPILSHRRLDVYHTSTHVVALVWIQDADLQRAARGSLKIQDTKIAICTALHNFVGLYLCN